MYWIIPQQEPVAGPSERKKPDMSLETLFVYGSLHNDQYFHILTGRSLPAQNGELLDHRRIQPRRSFAFAVPWKGSRIKGKLLTGVTPAILQKLDEYENEGFLYHRQIALCQTDRGPVPAYVYIGDPRALTDYIKKGFMERDRIEEFVEKQVQRYLENKADRCLLMDQKNLALMVTRELLSEEIETILAQHFAADGLPSFVIRHEIENANLPSLDWLEKDPVALPYAGSYMTLAVKFMVFNQLEEHFRNDFRGRVHTPDAFYHRTVSGLMALKLLSDRHEQLHDAMNQLRVREFSGDLKYPDYGVSAIMIARELYQQAAAEEVVNWIESNLHPGLDPLGAELEFSELGRMAIGAGENQDSRYDGFYYFYDFDLMRRGWKLGAHIDDHGFLATVETRTRGFLELAFGRYRLLGDISKPATRDPWILAQMIRLAGQFIGVTPHSLHISIEARSDLPFRHWDDPLHFFCLLLLGGDLRPDEQGQLREWRIYGEEIINPEGNLCFSRLNKHHQRPDDRTWSPVVEFQFPRLLADYDYQPLIMALKGFQRHGNPFPFTGIKDCPNETCCAVLQSDLIRWAAAPTPLSPSSLNRFLEHIHLGLQDEINQGEREHDKYIDRLMIEIERQLHDRNQMITRHRNSLNR